MNVKNRRNTFLKKYFRIVPGNQEFRRYPDANKWPDECIVRDKNIVQFLNEKSWVSNAKDCIVKSRAMVRAEYNMDLDIYDMRLISMYFAKIKVCDITTRRVSIAKNDFVKYFGTKIEGKDWVELLEKHQHLAIDIDGITYKRTGNEIDLWPYRKENKKGIARYKFWKEMYFNNGKIICNISDDILRHTFGIEEGIGYIKYNISHLYKLTSGQIQFYEYARQYLHNTKEQFDVTIDKLRRILLLNDDEYTKIDNFKKSVKRLCDKISEYTDLKIEVNYNLKIKAQNNRTYDKCSFMVTDEPPKECRQIKNEEENKALSRSKEKVKSKLKGKKSRKIVRKWETVLRPYTTTKYLILVDKLIRSSD